MSGCQRASGFPLACECRRVGGAQRGTVGAVRYIAGFIRFWYDFIVGEDWSVAAGVIALPVLTSFLTRRGIAACWLLPGGVVIVLWVSLWRVVRRVP